MKTNVLRSSLTFFICLIFNTSPAQFRSLQDSLTAPHPLWRGDTAYMNFTPQGLRSNAPSAGNLLWERPSFAGMGATWSMNIKMEFNPSSSNFCEFRFLQNHGDYYAVRLSGNSTDDLSFVLHHNYRDTILAASPGLLNQSKPFIALRVERDTAAKFTVFVADTAVFSLTDSTLMQSSSLGIYARYTSSRVDKFLFSTLSAAGYDFRDTLGPEITKIDVLDPFTVEVLWDEWSELVPQSTSYALLYASDSEYVAPVDTLAVFNQFSERWHLVSDQPLPRGEFSLALPPSLDKEGNVSVDARGPMNVDYAPPKSAWITAIHPFDDYGGPFITVQCERELGPVGLKIIEEDGDIDYYSTYLDSGLTRLDIIVLPNLKLPKSAVILIEKDRLPLAMQPYRWSFEPHQEQGDFLLSTSAPNGTSAGWQARPLNEYVPQWHQPQAPPPQQPTRCFADEFGKVYTAFEEPPFAYLALPGEEFPAGDLAKAYSPLWPYVLPANLALVERLGDTTIAANIPRRPEPGELLLNEVHFDPDSLEEFVELANVGERWLYVHEVQLALVEEQQILRSDRIAEEPGPFTPGGTLYPVIAPGRLEVYEPPFALPNDSTELLLLGAFGEELDQMKYGPWAGVERHRSAERISLGAASTEGNWGPHQSQWCCKTEATPGEENSIANQRAQEAKATLSESLISFDPSQFTPMTQLKISTDEPAQLSLALYSISGELLASLMVEEQVPAGDFYWPVIPTEWNSIDLTTGTYLIYVQLKKNELSERKILPLSIYNP